MYFIYVCHASPGALRGPSFMSVAGVLRSFDPQLVASASKKSEQTYLGFSTENKTNKTVFLGKDKQQMNTNDAMMQFHIFYLKTN